MKIEVPSIMVSVFAHVGKQDDQCIQDIETCYPPFTVESLRPEEHGERIRRERAIEETQRRIVERFGQEKGEFFIIFQDNGNKRGRWRMLLDEKGQNKFDRKIFVEVSKSSEEHKSNNSTMLFRFMFDCTDDPTISNRLIGNPDEKTLKEATYKRLRKLLADGKVGKFDQFMAHTWLAGGGSEGYHLMFLEYLEEWKEAERARNP